MSKLLLYCPKAKKQKDLLWSNNLKHFFLDGAYNRLIDNLPEYLLNGTIPCECDFEVEEIVCDGYAYLPLNSNPAELETKGCLTEQELENYFTKKYGLVGYAIHIKNLHIFDKPRELSDFNKIIETTYGEEPDATITRAPQNMMRCCYEKKPKEWETGVLISIKPEYLCNILNGEKTIEVRKKVLKEMLENEL